MIHLPFTQGFKNNRWAHCLDVMLEKHKGMSHLHQLRIIRLIEANFDIAPMELENMECDDEANACLEGDLPLGWFVPLPGYSAMLQLGGNWFTIHLWANIKFANTSPPMINYILG